MTEIINTQEQAQELSNPSDTQEIVTTSGTHRETFFVAASGIAYEIKDPFFGKLSILNSHNAWWMEEEKLYALIAAFKEGHTIFRACIKAGISLDQYKYFLSRHPEFSSVKVICRQVPILIAHKTLLRGIDEDPSLALRYLSSKLPNEFSGVDSDDEEKQPIIQQTTAVQVNINNGVDAGKLQEIAFRILERVKSKRGGIHIHENNSDGSVESRLKE